MNSKRTLEGGGINSRRKKKNGDAMLLKDASKIEEEIEKLVKRSDEVDQETNEADLRRIKMLRMKKAQLNRLGDLQQSVPRNPIVAGPAEVFRVFQGRQVVLGGKSLTVHDWSHKLTLQLGSGDIPLPPSLSSMKAPPLPVRGRPSNAVPSPPAPGARLRPIPPPPVENVKPTLAQETASEVEDNSSYVRATISLDRFYAQLKK